MYVDTKETAFLHDLSKPSLEALSHVLRHPEKWPYGFAWEYKYCWSCAMGLAGRLWKQIKGTPYTEHVARVFGMSQKAAQDIFAKKEWICSSVTVTPDMVADEIDKYLASRKG